MSGRLSKLLAAIMLLLASAWPMAQALPRDAGRAVVDLIADHEAVAPGSTFRGALTLLIDDQWHVYWKNPGDSGLPPELIWDEATNVQTGEFFWPAPHPQPLEGLMNYGYSDKLVLPFEIQVPEDASGEVLLTGMAQYLICMDICIPEEAQVFLSVPVADKSVPNNATRADFAWAEQRVPTPLDGRAVIDRSSGNEWVLSVESDALNAALSADIEYVRFFPEDHQILHAPEQGLRKGEAGLALTLQEAEGLGGDGALAGVLVVAGTDKSRYAVELTAQPGSVISGTNDKAVGMTTGVQTPDSSAQLTVIGLLGFMAAALIGGLILNLMPCVLPVLFIKARGVLELAGHDDQSAVRRHGFFYLVGVVTCFLVLGGVLAVLRAAGEQVGLGFQLQYPAVVAGLALLIFVLGLNMMGMFHIGSSLMNVGSDLAAKRGGQGAFFTGLLAAFVGAPCVGPFLGAVTGILLTQSWLVILVVFLCLGIGMALPFALLGFFPGLVKSLPEPGAWMERLKQFFAFPLFLTAIWLLSVLGAQAGTGAIVLTIAAATVIVFGIWLLKAGSGENGSARIVKPVALLIALAAFVLPIVMLASTSQADAPVSSGNAETYGEVWSTDRVTALREEGRPVFIDFTASWCVTCQVNKRTTLTTSKVQAAFEEENVAFLVADWTRRDKAIGQELAKHGRAGVPLYLYYPAGKESPVILPQILSPDLIVQTVQTN